MGSRRCYNMSWQRLVGCNGGMHIPCGEEGLPREYIYIYIYIYIYK